MLANQPRHSPGHGVARDGAAGCVMFSHGIYLGGGSRRRSRRLNVRRSVGDGKRATPGVI